MPLVESQRVEAYEVRGVSGTAYQIEIQFFWDGKPGDTIRVMGSIDERHSRLCPIDRQLSRRTLGALEFMMMWPNHALLQRTAAGRRSCNRCASWPPSLSLGR